MLSEAQYQTYVTGNPAGVVHAVTNPDTGESFDFAGTADGRLVHTIASLYDALEDDGTVAGSAYTHYLGLASYQMSVAGGTPVLWACQRPQDVDALQALLTRYAAELRAAVPHGSISVQAVVPAAGSTPDEANPDSPSVADADR